MEEMVKVVPCQVGSFSWATGFVPATLSLFDEVRRNPIAVFNRLCNQGRWSEAEWVLDNLIQ